MLRCGNPQKIHDKLFRIVIPLPEMALLFIVAHIKAVSPGIPIPFPVHFRIQLLTELLTLPAEIFSGHQRTHDKQRRVNHGDLRLSVPGGILHVQEVVIEAVHPFCFLLHGLKRPQSALPGILSGHISPLCAHSQTGQTESHRSNRTHIPLHIVVPDQPVAFLRLADLIPEEIKALPLLFLQNSADFFLFHCLFHYSSRPPVLAGTKISFFSTCSQSRPTMISNAPGSHAHCSSSL